MVSRIVVALLGREPPDQVVELVPRLRVEPRGRLVQEQQLRPPDDPDRDVEPAPLPAGQRLDLLLRVRAEPDRLEQLAGRPTAATAVAVEYGA